MAKNWTLKEAVVKITEGTDTAAIQDLAGRYPLTSIAIAKMGTNAGIATLFDVMPEHMTMLKMERALKSGVAEAADDIDKDDEPVKEAAVDESTEDLAAMTTKQLYELCVKRGLKVNKYGKSKTYYIEQLTNAADASDDADEDDADDGETTDYSGMSVIELYKLCKKRGLKVEPKKKPAVYIEALKADDAAANDEADEDDDWGDDEEEEKPAKNEKKQPAKKSSKPAAKVKDDDEEDDWDI